MTALRVDLDPYSMFLAYVLLVGIVLTVLALAEAARERRKRNRGRARQLWIVNQHGRTR